jgi:hypothetical protein
MPINFIEFPISMSCPSLATLQNTEHIRDPPNILAGRKELMEQLWTILAGQIYVLSMSICHEGCNLQTVSTGNHALNQAAGVTLAAYTNPNDIVAVKLQAEDNHLKGRR